MIFMRMYIESISINKCSDREGILNNTNLYITVFYQRSLV